MLPAVVEIILVRAPDPAGLIYFEYVSLFSFAVPDFPGEVDIFCPEEVVIDHAVEGTLADHKGIAVIGTDMVKRLPSEKKRRDDVIQMAYLLFRIRDTGSCFRKQVKVFLVSIGRIIKTFLQGAAAPVGTAIADIRRLFQPAAPFFFKVRTVRVAFYTEGAALSLDRGTGSAQEADRTVPAVKAGIIGTSIPTGPSVLQMVSDLPRDGGAVLAYSAGDLFKGRLL